MKFVINGSNFTPTEVLFEALEEALCNLDEKASNSKIKFQDEIKAVSKLKKAFVDGDLQIYEKE